MNPGLFQIMLALVISITGMILLTRYLNLHAFFSLIVASVLFGLMAGKPLLEIFVTLQAGFGTLVGQIGLLIAVGSCLGMVLEKTGAMEVISQQIVSSFGINRSAAAMTVIGFIVGIPVFCDSGFIILSRLIPTIAAQASIAPARLSLGLASGLLTTHTLIPPTPGPLAAVANMGMSEHIGIMIGVGLIAAIPAAVSSYLFSKRLSRRIQFTGIISDNTLPVQNISAWKAFLPLILPIVLIAFSSFSKLFDEQNMFSKILVVAGQPVIALMVGLLTCAFLVRREQKKEWPSWISTALKDAGVIILITGAGGAFGSVIKSSGIDILLKEYISSTETQGILFLTVAYVITAALKTAQGSTTSAMIITSSLLAPLAISAGFNTPAQLATIIVAMGGGGMTVSHANDSYFWVISQFGGITPADMLRSYTLLTLFVGLITLLTSILLFLVL